MSPCKKSIFVIGPEFNFFAKFPNIQAVFCKNPCPWPRHVPSCVISCNGKRSDHVGFVTYVHQNSSCVTKKSRSLVV